VASSNQCLTQCGTVIEKELWSVRLLDRSMGGCFSGREALASQN